MKTGWQNGFYQRRWKAAGIEPGDIRSIDDITKLPTFDSDDIKKDQQENPPFGLINGPVREHLKRQPTKVQTSGGTTGKPRPTMYGPIEWEMNGLTMARVLYICGLRPGDVIQIPHTCSLGNAGWCCYKAAHDYLGALPLTTGTGVVTSSRRQIEIAKEWGTNVWYVRPEYSTQLAKVARDELKFDLRDLKTKFLGCGLGPDTDGAFAKQIEELWGCPVYDMYGTHEMGMGSFECQAKNGMHFMEDCTFFEIVDTETEKPGAERHDRQHGVHHPAPPHDADDPLQSARPDQDRRDRPLLLRQLLPPHAEDARAQRHHGAHPRRQHLAAGLPAGDQERPPHHRRVAVRRRAQRARRRGARRDDGEGRGARRRRRLGRAAGAHREAAALRSRPQARGRAVPEDALMEWSNRGREGKPKRILDRRYEKK